MKRHKLSPSSTINTYFTLEKKNGEYTSIAIDDTTTKEQAEKSSALMNKLRKKSSGSKFKKK